MSLILTELKLYCLCLFCILKNLEPYVLNTLYNNWKIMIPYFNNWSRAFTFFHSSSSSRYFFQMFMLVLIMGHELKKRSKDWILESSNFRNWKIRKHKGEGRNDQKKATEISYLEAKWREYSKRKSDQTI